MRPDGLYGPYATAFFTLNFEVALGEIVDNQLDEQGLLRECQSAPSDEMLVGNAFNAARTTCEPRPVGRVISGWLQDRPKNRSITVDFL